MPDNKPDINYEVLNQPIVPSKINSNDKFKASPEVPNPNIQPILTRQIDPNIP